MTGRLKAFLLLCAFLLAAGCATRPPWARYELCFGRSANAGTAVVPMQDWNRFRDAEIASRFPDGFTVFDASGYWRSGSTNYTEPSEVLMVVAPDTKENRDKLQAIANAYKKAFGQESVLQITTPARVDFH